MPSTARFLGPLQNLRELVAACATFQAWVGADTAETPATAALASTCLQEPSPESGDETHAPEELELRRPFALIDWFVPLSGMGGEPYHAQRIGQLAYVESGRLMLTFEADTDPAATTHTEALTKFVEKVEAIVGEMLGLAGTDNGSYTHLSLTGIELLIRPHRSPVQEHETQGDYWRVTLLVNVGI
jgi:hypothetical protein